MKTPIKDALQVVAAVVITGGMATAMALPNTTPSHATSSVKAQLRETPDVAVDAKPTAVTVAAKSTDQSPVKQPTWQDNPQKCNQNTQYIASDPPFNCIDKPVQNTAPAVTAAPPAASGSCDLANNYDWPKAVARAICMAESSGDPSEANWNDRHYNADGSLRCVGSFGLMEIGCFWFPYYGYSSADYYNGSVNMDIAYKIWARDGGFGAWSTFKNGAYLKYL